MLYYITNIKGIPRLPGLGKLELPKYFLNLHLVCVQDCTNWKVCATKRLNNYMLYYITNIKGIVTTYGSMD